VDGYAPIFSYIGREGYMLDNELRPGSQIARGLPEILVRNLLYLNRLPLKHPIIFRMDGGNDAYDMIKPLVDNWHIFIIKRNLRRGNPDYRVDAAQSLGRINDPCKDRRVYTGTIDKKGNVLAVPDVEVESWWTNMYESAETVIALNNDHGTSEQFHSELKTDMNVERLPSRKRAVNSLVLTVAMLAFNTLRLIG
jgi:hypothetical protein